MVGGGGVVICSERKTEIEYYRNIGQDSNNMAEAYGLWQGLKQLKDKGVGEVMVFGDSCLIIQAMNGASHCRNLRLDRLIKRIKFISRSFRQIEFFHILRELNAMADQDANKSMVVVRNKHSVNHLLRFDFLP